MLITEANVHWN